jgi:hypothetical protein
VQANSGESERLASAGPREADPAVSAARGILFEKATPQILAISAQICHGLSTGSAENFEVGVVWLRKCADVRTMSAERKSCEANARFCDTTEISDPDTFCVIA